ncbi:glycosyltransferase family 4 protein, partial [Patescibacteria group bacterium]|nr:glycosyltransferase family 4 protein [Patescibacteria group bacterium]
ITELRRKIERWVAEKSDKIIVPSQYLKRIIMIWGVPEDKINVVYNSFNIPVLPDKLNLTGFNIISVGRPVPWKGFGALIEIMPEVIKEIPDAKLYIIGSGPQREALKLQITNYKLQNNVFLFGQLSHDFVLQYLRAGDIFVLNTGYEGFSHLILEAMAMEIPVLTTNIGGNPEIIQSRENGILIEYNNKEELRQAIIGLYKNPELRKKITENAKIKVKEFSKEKMIKETVGILSGV